MKLRVYESKINLLIINPNFVSELVKSYFKFSLLIGFVPPSINLYFIQFFINKSHKETKLVRHVSLSSLILLDV